MKTDSYFGIQSEQNTDKMKGGNLTVRFNELDNPFFNEGRLTMECRRIYNAPFPASGFETAPKGNTPKDGYGERFIIYIGELVNVWEKY